MTIKTQRLTISVSILSVKVFISKFSIGSNYRIALVFSIHESEQIKFNYGHYRLENGTLFICKRLFLSLCIAPKISKIYFFFIMLCDSSRIFVLFLIQRME